jgi:molybdopterin converting factor small subunit
MSTGLVEIRAVVLCLLAPGGPGREDIVSVEVATIGEVLADLVRNYPAMAGQVLTEDGTLHRFVNVYVDDDDVRYLDQLDTKVGPGVTVTILPAVAGG